MEYKIDSLLLKLSPGMLSNFHTTRQLQFIAFHLHFYHLFQNGAAYYLHAVGLKYDLGP